MLLYQSLKSRLGKACAYCNLRFLFVAGRCGALCCCSPSAFQHEVHSEKLFGGNTWLFESLLPSCHARHKIIEASSPREPLLACYVLLFRPSSVNLRDDCVGKSQQRLKHSARLISTVMTCSF